MATACVAQAASDFKRHWQSSRLHCRGHFGNILGQAMSTELFRKALWSLGGHGLIAPSVTLPKYQFKEADPKVIARETQAHRIEVRTVKAGVEAWQAIGKH